LSLATYFSQPVLVQALQQQRHTPPATVEASRIIVKKEMRRITIAHCFVLADASSFSIESGRIFNCESGLVSQEIHGWVTCTSQIMGGATNVPIKQQ